MTYGLKGYKRTGRDTMQSVTRLNMYSLFKKRLDAALKRLAESGGEHFEDVERTYNELWPDGVRVLITREPDGGLVASFSTGETLRFKDFNDLGAVLLLMRDRKLFESLCIENNAEAHPEVVESKTL